MFNPNTNINRNSTIQYLVEDIQFDFLYEIQTVFICIQISNKYATYDAQRTFLSYPKGAHNAKERITKNVK